MDDIHLKGQGNIDDIKVNGDTITFNTIVSIVEEPTNDNTKRVKPIDKIPLYIKKQRKHHKHADKKKHPRGCKCDHH